MRRAVGRRPSARAICGIGATAAICCTTLASIVTLSIASKLTRRDVVVALVAVAIVCAGVAVRLFTVTAVIALVVVGVLVLAVHIIVGAGGRQQWPLIEAEEPFHKGPNERMGLGHCQRSFFASAQHRNKTAQPLLLP